MYNFYCCGVKNKCEPILFFDWSFYLQGRYRRTLVTGGGAAAYFSGGEVEAVLELLQDAAVVENFWIGGVHWWWWWWWWMHWHGDGVVILNQSIGR